MSEYYLEPEYDSAKSFYKKARVITDGVNSILYSYSTKVCEIRPTEQNKVNILGFYSQTTTRHIKDFLYQNGYEVGSSKFLYENYTEQGRNEVFEKEEKKRLRIETREAALKEKEERKALRLEKRKEKIQEIIEKELGVICSKDEIETLVSQELAFYKN